MPIAEESRQVTKARRKLKKQLEIMERQFTQSALKETVEKMYIWLDKNASTRVPLNVKGVRLFDGNHHSAKLSQSIEKQRLNIEKRHSEYDQKMNSLVGRVKTSNDSPLPVRP